MNNNHLIDQIEMIRNGFIDAYNFMQINLPESAATEEIRATRLANRLILELEAETKSTNKK